MAATTSACRRSLRLSDDDADTYLRFALPLRRNATMAALSELHGVSERAILGRLRRLAEAV